LREPIAAGFPVFRSRFTEAVLARTYIDDDECSIPEIAAMAGACPGTIAREFRRLVDARVLTSRVVGGYTLVRANHEAPFYQALHDLVVTVLRPAELIGEELADYP
jgi:hypothetical protein